jgi:hypothetical protein
MGKSTRSARANLKPSSRSHFEAPGVEQVVLGGDADALKCLHSLAKHGMNKMVLLDYLYGIPRNKSTFGQLLRGMGDGRAKRFPNQISTLASEIKRVNSPGWVYFEILNLKRSVASARGKKRWESMWEQFQTLPELLATYASFLDYMMCRRRQMRRHSVEKVEVLNLMRQVRDTTGRAHFGDIATLLNAAYGQAGKKTPYDEDDLNKLWRNNPSMIGEPLILSN